MTFNFGISSFGLLKTFGNRRIQFGQISSEFYGFDADRDFSAALNILHRGLGMSLKPGGNAPARRENENDGVALTASHCAEQ